jgi:murein DD-endopeptidase MepM/ murein hydrolase activator NlpD
MPRRPIRQAISLVELRETSQRRALRQRRLRAAGIGGVALVLVLGLVVGVSALGAIRGAGAENPGSTQAVASAGTLGAEAARVAATADPVVAATGVPFGAAATPHPTPTAATQGQAGGAGGDAGILPTSPEPEQLTGYKWPLRGARVTSFFEDRDDGTLVIDGQRVHEGLDLATYCGDHIFAAHDGTVIASGRHFDDQMGFDGSLDEFFKFMRNRMYELPIVVIVDDGNGYRSIYAHLSAATVKVGDTLKAGDMLGYEGASGNASGCHLHYEVYRADGPWMAIAPELVHEFHYPPEERERIDPFRVLSMKQAGHPRFMPGVDPPKISPGLGRASVSRHIH